MLKDTAVADFNDKLKLISGHKDYITIGTTKRYYSNGILKEAIKDLYDFHCQVCDSVIQDRLEHELVKAGAVGLHECGCPSYPLPVIIRA